MPLVSVNATIAQGESESAAVDCGGDLVRVAMPDDWTDAHLTFLTSADNVKFYDVADYQAGLVSINVLPDTAVFLPASISRGIRWLKLRSGTRDSPVPQAADRVFTLTIDQGAAATLLRRRR